MTKTMKLLLYSIVLFFAAVLPAQRTLSLQEAFDWALTNHPVAEMADAVELQGPAFLLRTQGAFDPKIAGYYDRKEYLGTEYFDHGNTEVSWQSPYAVKVAAGYDFASGQYLTDELFLATGGQTYLAVKLPLLQGLITDAARIDRRRGNVAVERQLALANIIRNDLRYDIAYRYAEWFYAEQILRINEETQDLLELYLANTRNLFELGDKPAVDTLEASVYLATQRLETRQARVDAQVAKVNFSELYWPLDASHDPAAYTLELLMIPGSVDWPTAQPELRELQLAISDFQLQQRLKREKLKPILDVNYYILGTGQEFPAGNSEFGGPFGRAYKVGATASYPIFNRKARGEVQEGRLKIVETEAKLSDKRRALDVKAEAYRQAVTAYQRQLDEAAALIRQSEDLLRAERTLFDLGESTQFLLNVRQQNLQKARLIRQKIVFSRDKSVAGWRWTTGVW